MRELDSYGGLTVDTRTLDDGVLTTLKTGVGFSGAESIGCDGGTLFCTRVYKENETYDVIYAIIGADGENRGIFHEREGIMPTLFKSPEGAVFASLEPYHPDKDLEISLPLFNRETVEPPKPGRPFLGEYAGTTGAHAVFHYADLWSDKKPDKLLLVEFAGGKIRKKHNIKLDLPGNNEIFIHDEGIHLIARDGDAFVHRLIDEKNQEKKTRRVPCGDHWFRKAFTLSFERDSLLVTSEESRIELLAITPAGKVSVQTLCDAGFEIDNMYQLARLAENCFAVLFNGQAGNGWFVVREGELAEIFVSVGEPGFRELRSGVFLDFGRNDLVPYSINETRGGYALILEPASSASDRSVTFVLNRNIP